LPELSAAIVTYEFLYTSAIRAASCSQSSLEFWIMQRESIQMYLIPKFLVIVTASRNVAGKMFMEMDLILSSIFLVVVRRGDKAGEASFFVSLFST
jgi:hypothetical protein